MSRLVSNILRNAGTVLRAGPAAHPRTCFVQHCQPCSTQANQTEVTPAAPLGGMPKEEKKVKISKAMMAYHERAVAHDKFMADQVADYEIGRRHLANIMGEDPETFTQEDIDAAIQYLLPSGLFEAPARPQMKHPKDVFIKTKAAEFDMTGRPFHFLFYTCLPSYYQALHDLGKTVISLDKFADRMAQYKLKQETSQAFNSGGSEWVSKEELEEIFVESLRDWQYDFFIRAMTRLLEHPYSERARDFLMQYRKIVTVSQNQEDIPKLMYTAEGIPYMTATGRRRWCDATVTVYGLGSGKIDINGEDLRTFKLIQDREQVVFPLQFTGLLGKVDVVGKTAGIGGPSSISGSVRLAISLALRSFVDAKMRERMRLAGLLTWERRHRERKKPGQKGPRAKYTWKKR